MGTRGLTAVILDGERKIAQYGQWDHYPSGQGRTVLAFCRELADDAKRAAFVAALGRCRFATDADVDIAKANEDRWQEIFPTWTRDHGAKILGFVASLDGEIVMRDEWNFGADSLFCEWAYVIDVTAGTLEVYRGFNKRPPAGRFASLKADEGSAYAPVTLAKTYRIADLPTDAAFIDELENAAESMRGEAA